MTTPKPSRAPPPPPPHLLRHLSQNQGLGSGEGNLLGSQDSSGLDITPAVDRVWANHSSAQDSPALQTSARHSHPSPLQLEDLLSSGASPQSTPVHSSSYSPVQSATPQLSDGPPQLGPLGQALQTPSPSVGPLAKGAGASGWDPFAASPSVAHAPSISSQASSDHAIFDVELRPPQPQRVAVDGVPHEAVDQWFAESDRDKDGRVGGPEARDFFLRTGLAPGELSKVWRAAKRAAPAPGDGLTRDQFAVALRTVAYAQTGRSLEDRAAVEAAANPMTWLEVAGLPLPPPRLAPPEGSQQPPRSSGLATSPDPPAAGRPRRTSSDALSRTSSASARAALGGLDQSAARLRQLTVSPPSPTPDGGVARAAVGGGAMLVDVAEPPGAPPVVVAGDGPQQPAVELPELPAEQRQGLTLAYPHHPPHAPRPFKAESMVDRDCSPDIVAAAKVLKSPSMPHRLVGHVGVAKVSGELKHWAPLCFEARLPPLHAKQSAKLLMLASGCGSLFAAPSKNGGLLQWGRTEGNLRRPADVEARDDADKLRRKAAGTLCDEDEARWRVESEDFDASPCHEVCDKSCKRVTCTHMDHTRQALWTGHADGRISVFGIRSGQSAARLNSWLAYKTSAVTAIAVTPWGDVWTGSSRGFMRVWPATGPTSRQEDEVDPEPVRELRRNGSTKAHGGAVSFLIVPTCGQVVWSASEKTLCLWDISTGSFLGRIGRDREETGDRSASPGPPNPYASVSSRWEGDGEPCPKQTPEFATDESSRSRININKGLDLDDAGRIDRRPTPSERNMEIARQRNWAQQTDSKMGEFTENVAVAGGKAILHAGKGIKFLGKLVQKTARNVISEVERPINTKAPISAAINNGPHSLRNSLQRDSMTSTVGGEREEGEMRTARLRCLLATPDGYVWAAYKNGRLERYTAEGMLHWWKEGGTGIRSLAAVGARLWVGLADGQIKVVDGAACKPECLAAWQAHEGAVISIAQAGSRVYSLAADGSIKGWNATIPSGPDDVARFAFQDEVPGLMQRETCQALVLTWNVNEQKPEKSRFFQVLRDRADSVQFVAVCLQEIEMGGGSVAIAAAKDAILKSLQEKGNANAQWWSCRMLEALGGGAAWCRVGLRQLSGMLLLVFARAHLKAVIGEVSTASVACGVLGVGGNKGAVAVGFTMHRRKVMVVCSHFAAHQEAVHARNANYATIVSQLRFQRRPWYDLEGNLDNHYTKNQALGSSVSSTLDDEDEDDLEIRGEGIKDAEVLVWCGDFNYRIDLDYATVVRKVERYVSGDKAELADLLARDQLAREMEEGRIFRGLQEGRITFQPTYKFDKGVANPLGYDSSEKRRIPAWTDRVFFRGSTRLQQLLREDGVAPAVDPIAAEEEFGSGGIRVRASEYSAILDATESDHKPVFAVLHIDYAITDQKKKRKRVSHYMKQAVRKAVSALGDPDVHLSSDHIQVHAGEAPTQALVLSNAGGAPAFCTVAAAPLSESARGTPQALPPWLEVHPLTVFLGPGESREVSITGLRNEHVYETRALQAELVVRVDGELQVGGERRHIEPRDRRLLVVCLPEHSPVQYKLRLESL